MKQGDRMLRVTLETITPMFLSGSNTREVELRAPSFRGVMRFWLRALLGGVLGDNPQEIFKNESAVFGSTEHASLITIRVQQKNLHTEQFSGLAKWNEQKSRYERQGIAYLFFSARRTGQKQERIAISANQEFVIDVLTYHPTLSAKALEFAYASLWLLTHFGGIGSRSRRGGGNLQVRSVQGNVSSSLPSLQVKAKTPSELLKELTQGLSQLRQWAAKAFNGSLQLNFSVQPEFDVLHPKFCKIWVVNKTFNTWIEALEEFGSTMQQFRQKYEPDHRSVKAVVFRGVSDLQTVKRAAFGLPIVFYYRRPSEERATLEGENHDRRASPLIVRVVKLANDKCTLVLLRFIAPLLPADEKLKLRHHNREITAEQPDESILQEFLKQLKTKSLSSLEVVGW